ncbi:MAG: phosphoserine phosphatase RsbU/P [Blastocatellia bacterium]|nr:phosphoserine phosphatase RsbU/P [Blastocatellia bacterium]
MASATTILSSLPDHLRLQRLEALVVASEALNRASGLDDILRAILDLISTQLECERATVFLLDQRTGKLHARQMAGSQQMDGSQPVEIILERGVGVAGYVAETGESVLINDVRADPRFDPSTDLRTGFLTRNMLCAALRKPGGALLGSLQAINARAEMFTDADLAYLESFAALAAIAVEREQWAQAAFRAKLLSTEMELARKIQQRLLPAPGQLDLPQPYSAWGMSQPCYDVGGDTYDIVMLPSGDCAFWVADVSGKGIGAALLMTTLQTELRAFVRSTADLSQLAFELNGRVNKVAPLGTYATLFLGVISVANRRLRFLNAGHLPPVWINSQSATERDFPPGGMPIGLLPGSRYETGETTFLTGERLAVFSDGVTDAVNTAGEAFNAERVAAQLARIKTAQDVALIGAGFLAELDRFRIGAQAQDDTTFLVIGFD